MNPDGVALVITALVPLVAAVAPALVAWRCRRSSGALAREVVVQGHELDQTVPVGL
jgi:hypothetical protein